MKEQDAVGPIHIPLIPRVYQKTRRQVSGIPIAQYANPVMKAPAFYFPEAFIAEEPIP